MGQKHKNLENFGRHFSALHPQKFSHHVHACGAIFSNNSKIVPYHKDSSNSKNDARLRSPPLITSTGLTSLIAENWTKFGLKAGI